ncbi:MAG: anti-sigma factor (TIGR02949 family) [Candidatus Latescibacterota bacterium]|jgi:anti-sigma factor (TIGR02949 family)|tara:strand:+ start:764 stop:1006 length:243 start_codon:yes stop_codon:yes gene_type:complete
MHSCQQVIDALGEYLDGDLSPADAQVFEMHMRDCPPCNAFFKTYQKSGDMAREALCEREVPQELQDRVHDFLKDRLGLNK